MVALTNLGYCVCGIRAATAKSVSGRDASRPRPVAARTDSRARPGRAAPAIPPPDLPLCVLLPGDTHKCVQLLRGHPDSRAVPGRAGPRRPTLRPTFLSASCYPETHTSVCSCYEGILTAGLALSPLGQTAGQGRAGTCRPSLRTTFLSASC
jgi:hypothetical protein